MSIAYSTLFARLGKLVKWSAAFVAYQGSQIMGAGPTGGADDILSQYNARRDLVTGVQQQWQGQAGTMAGWVGSIVSIATATLQDLQAALDAPNNSVATILPLLYADMVANSQNVKASTVSAPSSTAGGSNVGNGQLILSKVNVLGHDDERILNETVSLVCTTDQFSGAAAGSEQFSCTGFPASSVNSYQPLGNGNGPTIKVADSQNLLTNGNFETFVANAPTGWTTVGTVGTNIKSSATAHSGALALQLAGDGTTATISATQAINAIVSQQKIYAIGVWVRKSGTVTSGSNLQIAVTGSGFSAVNLFNADPSTLTTSYQFLSAFFPTGIPIPANLSATINWTTANSAGATASILVDDYVLTAPAAFGNVQYALFRGSTDFLKTDSFAVTTANSFGGLFSSFFARYFSWQPPTTSGTPSQLDSLAM